MPCAVRLGDAELAELDEHALAPGTVAGLRYPEQLMHMNGR